MSGIELLIQGVSHVFEERAQKVEALRPVDLEIRAGEFVSIVGPSGCGKTTLLRLVAGLLEPAGGQILASGGSPAQLRSHKQIGWMAQQPALMPWRTVWENVELPLIVNGRHGRAERPGEGARELLDMVGLAEFSEAYPHTLSGGMRQRVALARTLATGAALWLMDEPFASLDELTREELGGELLDLWRRFRPTVLWVTHHLAEAVRLSDRIILFSARPGRVIGEIVVDLPHPRDDTAAVFQGYVRQARGVLSDGKTQN